MEAPILVCEAEHKACANDSFGNSELHKTFRGVESYPDDRRFQICGAMWSRLLM